jgi:hypothetical protein
MALPETRAVKRSKKEGAEVTQSETRAVDSKEEGWGRGDTSRNQGCGQEVRRMGQR